MESFRLGYFFLPDGVFSDFDDVWLRYPLKLYIVEIPWGKNQTDNSVKEVYCFKIQENLISGVFACFVGVFARFVDVSARKKYHISKPE